MDLEWAMAGIEGWPYDDDLLLLFTFFFFFFWVYPQFVMCRFVAGRKGREGKEGRN